jgi:putative ABC transport system permease protein
VSVERVWHICRRRVRSLFLRSAVDRELDDELWYHIDRQIAEHVSRGMNARDARAAALRAIGGLERRREECRDTRRLNPIDDLWRDCRYAVRILRRSPGFTVAAVLSLALGIGANTAIFQLFEGLRLRPLPVNRPQELAIIQLEDGSGTSGSFSGRYPHLTYPQWLRLRAAQQAFTDILAWSHGGFDLAPRGESRFAEDGLLVSGNFFQLLGVPAFLGRVFTDADDQPGCGAPGVVLSHRFWRHELDADPAAVGKTLTINGRAFQVVGVTPAGFFGVDIGRSFDFAVPLCAEQLMNRENSRIGRGWAWWLAVTGRLKPGWSLEQARAHLASLSNELFRETLPPNQSPETIDSYLAFKLRASPGQAGYSRLREQYDTPLWMLSATAGAVLLIACANLANLMLVRNTRRARELSVRLALGASRLRVVRQLLVESLLLAVAGAMLGGWLAPMVGRAIVGMMSSQVEPLFIDVATDWRVLGFTAALTIVTCVLCGVAPAIRSTRVSLDETIRAATRAAAATRAQSGLRRMLVVVQVALTLVLLVGALLLTRSLVNLLTLDAGFQQHGILEVDIDSRRLALPPEKRPAFQRMMLEAIQAIQGVDAAASVMTVPLVGNWGQTIYVDGPSVKPRGIPRFNGVSPGFFRTMRTPVVAGREFDGRDTPESDPVALVNDAFAQTYLGGSSPLGRTFRVDGPDGKPGKRYEIVGMVGNTKYASLREPFQPIVYLASGQNPRPGEFTQILIRTALPLATVQSAVKRTVDRLNGDVAFHFHDFQEQIRYSLLQDRLMAALCGFFAALAAVLAVIGVYGVIAYSATARTHEVGIRQALGASRREIVDLILREALALIGLGLLIGAGLSLLSSTFTGAMLFGLGPRDLTTLLGASGLLAAVALIAAYLPARRAANTDPLVALRCE